MGFLKYDGDYVLFPSPKHLIWTQKRSGTPIPQSLVIVVPFASSLRPTPPQLHTGRLQVTGILSQGDRALDRARVTKPLYTTTPHSHVSYLQHIVKRNNERTREDRKLQRG